MKAFITLKSGPVTVLYQEGMLRTFRVHNEEVLRMICFTLRDHNWGTFMPVISNEKIERRHDSFRISYTINYYNNDEIFFTWAGIIDGKPDGEIYFEIKGNTLLDFHTNRAGLFVLHPVEGLQKEAVIIIHSDGTITHSMFPEYISPYQVFQDIKSMQWQMQGNQFNLFLKGDEFETEDHRNWGDASFKSYCTPLERPFPFHFQKGHTVAQKIIFKPLISDINIRTKGPVLPAETKRSFAVGIAAPAQHSILTDNAGQQLKQLGLEHYRVEVSPAEEDWEQKLLAQWSIAKQLSLLLKIVLLIGDNVTKELAVFLKCCEANKVEIKYLLLLGSKTVVTPQTLIDKIPSLKTKLPFTKIGAGTNYNFTEINRHRFDASGIDFISFSFHPQEHAFDDLSLMENAACLKYLVESAEAIYHKPVHISPITLKARFNPYATGVAEAIKTIAQQTDKRQQTVFAADWVKACLAILATTNIASVTFFQTTGPLGIMNENGDNYPVHNTIKNRSR